jgi:hypothetical protein
MGAGIRKLMDRQAWWKRCSGQPDSGFTPPGLGGRRPAHPPVEEGGLDGSAPDLVNVAQRHGCILVAADQRNLLAR